MLPEEPPMLAKNQPFDPPRVVIVGGGLAGLTAALHLADRGLAPTVVEAAPTLGGRLRTDGTTTVSSGGQPWTFPDEHGIHGIWGQYHNVRALLSRLDLGGDTLPAQGQEWVHAAGDRVRRVEIGRRLTRTVWPAPFHYVPLLFQPGFVRMLSPLELLRLPIAFGVLIATASVDPIAEPALFEGKQLTLLLDGWPTALRALFGALARNGLSTVPEEASLGGFIAWLRFYSLRRRDAWAFRYFRGDASTRLIEPLANAASLAGAVLRSGVSAVALDRGGERRWRVVCSPDRTPLDADAVIVATDAPASRRLLTASGTTMAERAAQLDWPTAQPTVVVRLWFSILPRLRVEAGVFTGSFSADNFFWLQNIHDSAYLWHRATGGSVVELHFYGPPDLLSQPDETLRAVALADVERAFPDVRGSVLLATVRRNPATHTVLRFGSSERHLGVQSPWAGLWCCGDWVRYATPALYMERACVTGIAAANGVLEEARREPWPLAPHDPPEPFAALLEAARRWARRPGQQ